MKKILILFLLGIFLVITGCYLFITTNDSARIIARILMAAGVVIECTGITLLIKQRTTTKS